MASLSRSFAILCLTAVSACAPKPAPVPAPPTCISKDWSIGIVAGSDPLHLSWITGKDEPIFGPASVTDRDARFTADPFLVREKKQWYLFFEVMNRGTEQGDIGCATSSNLVDWSYQGIVLDEPFHLSYPYVFKWKGRYYLIPESRQDGGIRLYQASSFPGKWRFVKKIIVGNFADSSIVRFRDKWWIFTCDVPYSLNIFYAKNLLGPWHPHAMNPITKDDKTKSRPGGRMVIDNGKLIRFAQDGTGGYGHSVRAFIIDSLSTKSYREHQAQSEPLLTAAGTSWRWAGMHTDSPIQRSDGSWVSSVDGAGCPVQDK